MDLRLLIEVLAIATLVFRCIRGHRDDLHRISPLGSAVDGQKNRAIEPSTKTQSFDLLSIDHFWRVLQRKIKPFSTVWTNSVERIAMLLRMIEARIIFWWTH